MTRSEGDAARERALEAADAYRRRFAEALARELRAAVARG